MRYIHHKGSKFSEKHYIKWSEEYYYTLCSKVFPIIKIKTGRSRKPPSEDKGSSESTKVELSLQYINFEVIRCGRLTLVYKSSLCVIYWYCPASFLGSWVQIQVSGTQVHVLSFHISSIQSWYCWQPATPASERAVASGWLDHRDHLGLSVLSPTWLLEALTFCCLTNVLVLRGTVPKHSHLYKNVCLSLRTKICGGTLVHMYAHKSALKTLVTKKHHDLQT